MRLRIEEFLVLIHFNIIFAPISNQMIASIFIFLPIEIDSLERLSKIIKNVFIFFSGEIKFLFELRA